MAAAGASLKVANVWVRYWLWVVVGLVSLVGVVLYIFPRRTEDLFAWTIGSPMTAAFLGASYWASIPLSLLGSFRRYWADLRIAFHGVGVFSVLTLVATFNHLDKFHTSSVPGVIWIATYIVAPFVIFGIVIWMGRAMGADPPRIAPLATWERALLLLISLGMVPLGLALFIAPGWADGVWPWALTPLTGQAVGAWLVGIGTVVLHICWENDWVRIAPGPPAFALLGVLHLVAVARFNAELHWSGLGAWLYLACLVGFTAIGLYGIVKCRRLGIRLTPAGMAQRPLAPAQAS
ncbi:MAG: hypothetical protein DCC58_10505 [Chloroflexi bacterium]|nr:MAG: hypothetical protein DCC58_10505 [Chloroflexota bacterium]